MPRREVQAKPEDKLPNAVLISLPLIDSGKKKPVSRSYLPEPDSQVEAELTVFNKDELDEEGELPEGTTITYKGEDYTLRKYGFFEIQGLRFRATFQQSAEGVTRKVFRAPFKEVVC